MKTTEYPQVHMETYHGKKVIWSMKVWDACVPPPSNFYLLWNTTHKEQEHSGRVPIRAL
jgi:hypothetical protein